MNDAENPDTPKMTEEEALAHLGHPPKTEDEDEESDDISEVPAQHMSSDELKALLYSVSQGAVEHGALAGSEDDLRVLNAAHIALGVLEPTEEFVPRKEAVAETWELVEAWQAWWDEDYD